MISRPILPAKCRIAVPPGVGDVYWVLTKMKSFREKFRLEHVTFCVQKTDLTRALEWPNMTTGLVDAAVEFPFKKDKRFIDSAGFYKMPGVDCVMWPNTIVDKGQHLSQWMPSVSLDLNFEIKCTEPFRSPGIVVYPSSEGVNKAWLPGKGPQFWTELLTRISETYGQPATVIGAGWDIAFAKQIRAPYISYLAKTDLHEVAGIIKKATLFIGVISGMSILANHFGTPTLALYPDHRFPPTFPTAWCRPDIKYTPLGVSQVQSSQQVFELATRLLK